MKRRKNFHGNIDEYKTEDGPRFRVRARIDGDLKTLESGLKSANLPPAERHPGLAEQLKEAA